MSNVRQFCIGQLEQIISLKPGMRLALAIRHNEPSWLQLAVNMLTRRTVFELDEDVVSILPYEAYRIIAKMHAKIMADRLTLVLLPPPTIHTGECIAGPYAQTKRCEKAWETIWKINMGERMLHPNMLARYTLDEAKEYWMGLNIEPMSTGCPELSKDNIRDSAIWGAETETIRKVIEKLEEITRQHVVGMEEEQPTTQDEPASGEM